MAKLVEVDEEAFLNNEKLRKTVATIMAHPKAKLLVQQAHKLVDPNASTPDLDAQTSLDEPIGALKQELAEMRKQAAEDKADRERQERINALKSTVEREIAELRSEGWQDEGLKAVQEVMDTKGIMSPKDAAAIVEKNHPPATPIIPSSFSAHDYLHQPAEGGDEFLKALLATRGESDGVLNKKVAETLAEARGQRR